MGGWGWDIVGWPSSTSRRRARSRCGAVRVASQVKALIAGGHVDKRFDPAAAAGFFLRGTVPEPFTMYRAIRALPAGSYCWIDSSGVHEPVPYFSIAATLRDAVENPREVSAGERNEIVHD